MGGSSELVEALKRELKGRGITYAAVASALKMSEASVKRMFARRDFTLSRLDAICALAGMELPELVRASAPREAVLSRLTYEQEKELVDNPKLMLVALCTLNHWRFEDIVRRYALSEAECVTLLARLDRLKFIELLPGNRIRLLVSRAFSWIPDGPIQRLFKEHFAADFFRSRFEKESELMVLANGALSRASLAALLARLRKAAAEFSALRSEDAALPASERTPVTLLLAARPWAAEFLQKYRRR
ncbi:MAG TPA: helix-turn-helix domain-containing protein [Burkholderiales bacterium]|nr:helix-turn-helix domain-containing protein [Burkholderiales bacterium]